MVTLSPISPVATANLRSLTEVAAPGGGLGVQSPLPLGSPSEVGGAAETGESFASVLGRMVTDVNTKQFAASNAVNALQSGQPVPLHQAMIALEEASVSFQLMVEVRNHLLESYQELMRMQI